MPYSYSSRVSNIIAFLLFVSLFPAKPTVENSLWCPLTSSASSSDTLQSKYDVFVSFRGPDVREGFLSHLIEALSLNQIVSFVDYNIPKGHQISDALPRAIEESANLAGFHSSTFRDDAKLVKEIVKCVSSMVLNLRLKVNSKEPYEIGTQFPHAETFLQLKSEDLPVIGCIDLCNVEPHIRIISTGVERVSG
ncbi:hypothetical protein VNO80_00384 [Phaseolus coccineus]|uniref:TIR domain-containing protein n=1 Tax=Phaseolus coccineus TaxID=3886 RepID=A0AAN9NYW3_PHACN